MTVQENNVQIAKKLFGAKKDPYSEIVVFPELGEVSIDKLAYHHDYNWLMEAVEKLDGDVYTFRIIGNYCGVNYTKNNDNIYGFHESEKKESIYRCVCYLLNNGYNLK